jgi:hypothetical protein
MLSMAFLFADSVNLGFQFPTAVRCTLELSELNSRLRLTGLVVLQRLPAMRFFHRRTMITDTESFLNSYIQRGRILAIFTGSRPSVC